MSQPKKIAPTSWNSPGRFGNAHLCLWDPQSGGGLAVDPKTGELWCSINERDGLGDNLVPDYITHVQEGGFYGWPWWYMGGHQDPRHEGKHPELKVKSDHSGRDPAAAQRFAAIGFLRLASSFPPNIADDIFASEHGSWNKSVRAGYELIRVPLHQTGTPAANMRISLPDLSSTTATYGAGQWAWPWRKMARCW